MIPILLSAILSTQQPDLVVTIDGMRFDAAEHAIYVHEQPPRIAAWTTRLQDDGFEPKPVALGFTLNDTTPEPTGLARWLDSGSYFAMED